ncbi:regulatory signaling modulator protein AmpE [Shigella flexneri]
MSNACLAGRALAARSSVEAFFGRVKHFLRRTLDMTIIAMGVSVFVTARTSGSVVQRSLAGGVDAIGLLCIGAGKVRLHYHAYLTAASRDDRHARDTMASELTLIPRRSGRL